MLRRPAHRGGFFMDRFFHDLMLAVYGDEDAGYGKTYSQIDEEAEEEASHPTDTDLLWSDFNYGDRTKRKKRK